MIKADWTLNDVDECDIVFLMNVLAYGEREKEKSEKVTIDEIF